MHNNKAVDLFKIFPMSKQHEKTEVRAKHYSKITKRSLERILEVEKPYVRVTMDI
jgi:hypothetical protein